MVVEPLLVPLRFLEMGVVHDVHVVEHAHDGAQEADADKHKAPSVDAQGLLEPIIMGSLHV